MISQELFNLESLLERHTTRAFCSKVLNFQLANEFLTATFFLILRKFIFENKRVTINTWDGVDLISWKHYRFQTFYKQKICNNRLIRKIVYPAIIYCSLQELLLAFCLVQFIYLKCYNQSFTMHYAIYSTSYSTDKVLFVNKKDREIFTAF